uniref:Uncharacterized protein n=1 Tax=Chromera velia CCMP2878 TaxID=1169474 RepID=A0A0G4GA21_9ALVE|eukprot:Cvel_20915.t1-p1 / transcript=Cvel_20915.t1 / gene=Cvel_20915 / organism=Chromera_velia_CCMP2878 / gene_product=hypothetical protein / transcript_product=hypothetical protein / location=Cvel_scaffold1919:7621-12582(-) / protein_length=141 / sequence_SO=supercontig / SO=protein_coding / is_pseudo=false
MRTGRKRPVFCSGSPSCGKCICNECFSEILRTARPPRRPALCPFCRRGLCAERRYNDELMRILTVSRFSMRQVSVPEHPSVSFVRIPTRVREQAVRFGAPMDRTEARTATAWNPEAARQRHCSPTTETYVLVVNEMGTRAS